LDRDKLYTAGADDSDSDDAELELEPLDPEVLAAEQRRAAAALEVHRTVIDVDEVYRDLDVNRDTAIVDEWLDRLRNFRFQFQVKHLLVLTAVVAVVLVLSVWISLGTVFIVGFMLAVAGVSLYLKLEENKRQEEADRRRRKMYAERRAELARQSGQPVDIEDLDEEP
jgi:magnesium-transporting ATPase (P-type)